MKLRDFPDDITGPRSIAVKQPDEFILNFLDHVPSAVVAAAETRRTSLLNPPKSVADYLESLERQGLPRTVSVFRRYMV